MVATWFQVLSDLVNILRNICRYYAICLNKLNLFCRGNLLNEACRRSQRDLSLFLIFYGSDIFYENAAALKLVADTNAFLVCNSLNIFLLN